MQVNKKYNFFIVNITLIQYLHNEILHLTCCSTKHGSLVQVFWFPLISYFAKVRRLCADEPSNNVNNIKLHDAAVMVCSRTCIPSRQPTFFGDGRRGPWPLAPVISAKVDSASHRINRYLVDNLLPLQKIIKYVIKNKDLIKA